MTSALRSFNVDCLKISCLSIKRKSKVKYDDDFKRKNSFFTRKDEVNGIFKFRILCSNRIFYLVAQSNIQNR